MYKWILLMGRELFEKIYVCEYMFLRGWGKDIDYLSWILVVVVVISYIFVFV